MRKCFAIAVLIVVLMAISSLFFGCMDMTSENNNYNGTRPAAGTPQFAAIDTNSDGLISDEEWIVWVDSQQ